MHRAHLSWSGRPWEEPKAEKSCLIDHYHYNYKLLWYRQQPESWLCYESVLESCTLRNVCSYVRRRATEAVQIKSSLHELTSQAESHAMPSTTSSCCHTRGGCELFSRKNVMSSGTAASLLYLLCCYDIVRSGRWWSRKASSSSCHRGVAARVSQLES